MECVPPGAVSRSANAAERGHRIDATGWRPRQRLVRVDHTRRRCFRWREPRRGADAPGGKSGAGAAGRCAPSGGLVHRRAGRDHLRTRRMGASHGHFSAGLRLAWEQGAWWYVANCLDGFANLAALAEREIARALRLRAAAEVLRERLGIAEFPGWAERVISRRSSCSGSGSIRPSTRRSARRVNIVRSKKPSVRHLRSDSRCKAPRRRTARSVILGGEFRSEDIHDRGEAARRSEKWRAMWPRIDASGD